ncbi:Kinesin-like protein KIN-4C [Coccomyxa sp. Obi]|nr:Kinesin-like protein KIN-4C [Coccomyxa sp. Obi]
MVVCKDGPTFTYDYVYGGGGASPDMLYDQCVQPLVAGLFKGYNACCFAYGQTGSGKTYTMGSSVFTAPGSTRGVIPRVMESIFDRIAASSDTSFSVRVGFVEIFNEEIRDLLSPDLAAATSPSVHIREVVGGGVCLAGAHEKDVTSKEEMAAVLEQGSRCRATASTGMNQRSSRSHAIFTITVEQRRAPQQHEQTPEGNESGDEDEGAADEYLCAKMHLVDLAGSERQKRTKAEGARLKEGININMGLLALGNVVNALTENKAHIPYRDSKLTRMLQDSLGGNSKTTMIACVSPADINIEESAQTLRYANRARNIRNKPVVNRDPIAAQLSHLRAQLAAARAENSRLRRRVGETEGNAALEGNWSDAWGGTPGEDVLAAALEETEAKASKLDLENARLRLSLEKAKGELQETHEALISARVERDRNALRLQQLGHAPGGVPTGRGKENASPQVTAASGGESGGSIGGTGAALPDQDGIGEVGFIRGYLDRIAHLEKEIRRLKEVQRCSGAFLMSARRASMAMGSPASALKGGFPGTPLLASPYPMSPFAGHTHNLAFNSATPGPELVGTDEELGDLAGDEEYAAEEHAHRLQQEKRKEQLEALEKAMMAKEATWKRLNGGQGKISEIKARFDQELKQLQDQRDELQAERSQLIRSMERVKEASFEERHKLEKAYKERLKVMDAKLREVREKERRIAHMERLQARSLEKCDRLQADILSIKQQKVSLARQIEQNHKDFALWKKNRERELAQLRKQGRKQQMQVQKLEALQAKQAAVLRRKTEEADAARRRLKDIMDVHRTSNEKRERAASLSKSGTGVECQPNASAPLLRDDKGRRDWIEHELDMCCQSFELARVLEGEKAQRGEVAKKLADLSRRLAHANAVADRAAAAALEPERAALDSQLQQHSAHVRFLPSTPCNTYPAEK